MQCIINCLIPMFTFEAKHLKQSIKRKRAITGVSLLSCCSFWSKDFAPFWPRFPRHDRVRVVDGHHLLKVFRERERTRRDIHGQPWSLINKRYEIETLPLPSDTSLTLEAQESATSHQPHVSRMASPKKLSELSASVNNSRQISMLPPPQAGLKRKTLAERAGEVPRGIPAPPGSRLAQPTIRGTTLGGGGGGGGGLHQPGFGASTNHRPASAASSAATGLSASAIHGPDRHHVGTMQRPQTSMSSYGKTRSIRGHSRPASSFDASSSSLTNGARNAPIEAPANSMQSVFFRKFSANIPDRKSEFTHSLYHYPTSTNAHDRESFYTIPNNGIAQSSRTLSLSTAMRGLSIAHKHDPPSIFSQTLRGPATFPKSMAQTSPSKTSAAPSPTHPHSSPKKSPKKEKLFLNKFSNVKTPDWDLGSRVENMESMYADLKASLSTTTAESNGLKESILLYKARGNGRT